MRRHRIGKGEVSRRYTTPVTRWRTGFRTDSRYVVSKSIDILISIIHYRRYRLFRFPKTRSAIQNIRTELNAKKIGLNTGIRKRKSNHLDEKQAIQIKL